MVDAIERAEVLLDQGQVTSSHEVLVDEIERLRAALYEVTTNGRWTEGEQRGEWAISNEVYETARDALGNEIERLRRYIHELETIVDPAGDVRELFRLKTENASLRQECQRLADEQSAPSKREREKADYERRRETRNRSFRAER